MVWESNPRTVGTSVHYDARNYARAVFATAHISADGVVDFIVAGGVLVGAIRISVGVKYWMVGDASGESIGVWLDLELDIFRFMATVIAVFVCAVSINSKVSD